MSELIQMLEAAEVGSLQARILDGVEYDPFGGCWLWSGSTTSAGYGKFGKKTLAAHRVSYRVFNGPIGDKDCVCHRCDVRSCVNPDHLFLGTVAANNADMRRKGRSWQPEGGAAHAAKLSDEQARSIFRAVAAGAVQRRIAEQFSVSPQTINNIASGRTFAAATADLSDLKAHEDQP